MTVVAEPLRGTRVPSGGRRTRALMAVCSAPLLASGCGVPGDSGAAAPVGRDAAPRVMTSAEGLDVVAVHGNLYEITPAADGAQTVAAAKLQPMFADSDVPNEADAAAAVAHAFSERGCRSRVGRPLDHDMGRNEQRWTFPGYCA